MEYKTLEEIADALGSRGFVQYAKDYGNSKVDLNGSVDDAIDILFSYRNDEDLVSHFNEYEYDMTAEYGSEQKPYYLTSDFRDDSRREQREFGYITSM